MTPICKIKLLQQIIQETAVRYSISAKETFDALPLNEQTFDRYYNIFSSMTKYTTLMSKGTAANNQRNRGNPPNFIGNINSNNNNNKNG